MSGTTDPPAKPEGAAPAEPSMEDILASIRRILNEDGAAQTPPPLQPAPEDVLVLDSSMMVAEPKAEGMASEPVAGADAPVPADPPFKAESGEEAIREARLVAPEAAAAAAAAVGDLVKRLASERGTLVSRSGPTLEDLVREEMRPLLKAWLDANLPGLVERLVRAEIERVIGRIVP